MIIDEDLAELLGIHIGDGCISETNKYSEYYLGGDFIEEKEYHDNWVKPLFNKKIMNPIFGKDVNYKEHPKVGIYGFHIFDKKLVDFFKQLGISSGTKINIHIPKAILKDKILLKRFIRGLFDTDGSIYFEKSYTSKHLMNNHPIIQFGTVSLNLSIDVYNFLKKLGLNPRIKRPHKGKKDKNIVYLIILYRKNDINYYINEIGFKNPKHSTKWQVYLKFGYCPPKTKLQQRKQMLLGS